MVSQGEDNAQGTAPSRPMASSPLWVLAASLLVGLVSAAVLSPTLQSAWIFDDYYAILEKDRVNRFGQDGYDMWTVITYSDRPLVDATFALQLRDAPDRSDPSAFKMVNLIVHAFGAFAVALLCGLVATSRGAPEWLRKSGAWFALGGGLVWGVHPLTVQGVAYTVQRAESMASLFAVLCCVFVLLAARIGFIHGRVAMTILAFACIVLSVTAKPIAIGLVLLTLLLDRACVAPDWKTVWSRWWVHASVLLGAVATVVAMGMPGRLLATNVPGRIQRDVGLDSGASPLEYLMTQGEVIPLYFFRLVWPETLVLDYAWIEPSALGPRTALGLLVLATLAVGVWACIKKPLVGLAIAWWFVLLGPSSSIMPIRDMAFEHRVYLAMLGPIALAVAAFTRLAVTSRASWARPAVAVVAVAGTGLLGWRAYDRAGDYGDAVGLWEGQIEAGYASPRVRQNLSYAYMKSADDLQGETRDEALAKALENAELVLADIPQSVRYQRQLGDVLYTMGRFEDALEPYRLANELGASVNSIYDYALTLRQLNRHEEAAAAFLRSATFGDGQSDPSQRARAYYFSGDSMVKNLSLVPQPEREAFLLEVLKRFNDALDMGPSDADRPGILQDARDLRGFINNWFPDAFSDE